MSKDRSSIRTDDYRKIWLKQNPGLLKCMWICAYCGLPIFGKGNLQVDHVMPISRVVVQGNNRVTQAALAPATAVTKAVGNSQLNLVAAHGGCNRRKSNKIDLRVIIGYFFKLLSILFAPFVFLINGVFFGTIATIKWAVTVLVLALKWVFVNIVFKYWYVWLLAGGIYYYFFLK